MYIDNILLGNAQAKLRTSDGRTDTDAKHGWPTGSTATQFNDAAAQYACATRLHTRFTLIHNSLLLV